MVQLITACEVPVVAVVMLTLPYWRLMGLPLQIP